MTSSRRSTGFSDGRHRAHQGERREDGRPGRARGRHRRLHLLGRHDAGSPARRGRCRLRHEHGRAVPALDQQCRDAWLLRQRRGPRQSPRRPAGGRDARPGIPPQPCPRARALQRRPYPIGRRRRPDRGRDDGQRRHRPRHAAAEGHRDRRASPEMDRREAGTDVDPDAGRQGGRESRRSLGCGRRPRHDGRRDHGPAQGHGRGCRRWRPARCRPADGHGRCRRRRQRRQGTRQSAASPQCGGCCRQGDRFQRGRRPGLLARHLGLTVRPGDRRGPVGHHLGLEPAQSGPRLGRGARKPGAANPVRHRRDPPRRGPGERGAGHVPQSRRRALAAEVRG